MLRSFQNFLCHALSDQDLQKRDKPAEFLEVTQFEYICFMADAFYFVKTLHAIQGHENVYGLVTFWRNNQFVAITTHLRSCQ